jgi:hypothetical protein
VTFQVGFNDTSSAYSSYYGDLQRTISAAGLAWTSHFAPAPGDLTLTVGVSFASIATANGASATSSLVGTSGSRAIYEQGAAHKLKTGADDNGTAADIVFTVGTSGYLQQELWFDPDPSARTAPVPSMQTDAMSVFLHEFGHAFGFNGFRDGITGDLPGAYESTFDTNVTRVAGARGGPTLFFTGANAVSLYGGPVPLTFGNYAHIGNASPRDGFDLSTDLMNGLFFTRGTRYDISALDLAVMHDVGLPVAVTPVPEPETYALMLLGLVAMGVKRASGRRAGYKR